MSSSSSSWSVKDLGASLPSPSLSAFRQFSLAELTKATNNFDQSLLIRRGWSIEVYKGTYEDLDGTEITVAIKSFAFDPSWKQSHAWFEQERDAWSQCHHKHVVSLIGYCQEPPGTYMFVYEYMPNGSLANHLCTRITPSSFHLSWDQSLEICIDAARGLEYLHRSIRCPSGLPFIHSDVTLTNILLDGNGVAKISNLYNDPSARQDEQPTFMYDPEDDQHSILQQTADVYAFGFLLFKLLDRKAFMDYESTEAGILCKEWIMEGTIHHSIHADILAQISRNRLIEFLHIVNDCLNVESWKRPSFTQVVFRLELLIASSSSSSLSSERLCHRHSLNEIEHVTNNFESILGEGGEGTVYKGMRKVNNIAVAVKRLKPEYSSELQREIKMLSDLDHPNLVSLVGYCHESDESILIYEFMCNGNLAQNLYGRAAGSLSWKQRLNICIGAASGLRYLHTRTSGSRKGIIHRDVKPVNILLDENFSAKISDFGLSKMGPQDQAYSEIATMVKGTTGYYAPEYQRYGKITRRIDVYAFGVVLCEVLCRKKPWDREESFYPTRE